jgi:hypothetical protein
MKRLVLASLIAFCLFTANAQPVWTVEQATSWRARQPWIVGCNFIPSTAINELEMWQAETFDLPTIDRELAWAEGLGFNTVRVYLHNLLWDAGREEFLVRLDRFLETADRHHIRVILVLFDDCWLPDPKPGKQPDPVPGVHNSGWLRAPGPSIVADPTRWPALEAYTKGVLTRFRDDRRILMWDLYNEPGNSGMEEMTFPLLEKVFQWAWAVRPSQPLTCATWNGGEKFKRYNDLQLSNSDVITFHNYNDASNLESEIKRLQALGKPVICSEYMARTNNSTFEKNLPVLRQYQVGAINWGLVSGKTNTIFPWGSKAGSAEPAVWFHDIFRSDGTPFDPREVALIRQLTGKKP